MMTMNATQTGPHTDPGRGSSGDPRVGWSHADTPPPPPPAARRHPPPPLHPLVQDFLDALTSAQRDRFTGRCAETILISRHLAAADAARSKRATRKPMTNGEARKA